MNCERIKLFCIVHLSNVIAYEETIHKETYI